MELLIWLGQLPDKVLQIALLVLIGIIVITLSTAVALMAGSKPKEKHISGFANRKAKKGELKK